MKARDALSRALVLAIEGHPVVQAVSRSHTPEADDWVIVTRDSNGEYQTIREIPKEAP